MSQVKRPDAALELIGVKVPFGDGPGLVDISLRIDPGERIALVGASGAGKSSLLRVIAGESEPLGGELRIAGIAAAGRSPRERDVVFLGQRPLLFPHLSVRQNVAFPLEVRGTSGSEVRRRVDEALEAVEVRGLAERHPASLSGGQAHRVALARAVVARPALLLLDEPFSGLDPELRTRLQDTVAAVTARFDSALLLVTHDLREAGRLGDRVGVLLDRRLARLATPAALYRDPGSLAVARFIGWPNELPVTREGSGVVRVGDVRLELSSPLPPGGELTLVFGRDGGELAPSPTPQGIPVEIVAVDHQPHGATASWRSVDLFQSPPSSSHQSAVTPRPVMGEVAVDPQRAPRVGDRATLVIHTDRARIYTCPD